MNSITVNDLVNLATAIHNYRGPDSTFEFVNRGIALEAHKSVENGRERWFIGDILLIERSA
jgi:hypothetical protein